MKGRPENCSFEHDNNTKLTKVIFKEVASVYVDNIEITYYPSSDPIYFTLDGLPLGYKENNKSPKRKEMDDVWETPTKEPKIPVKEEEEKMKKLQDQIQELKTQKELLNSKRCSECNERPQEILFPCGHIFFCLECYLDRMIKGIDKCILCQKDTKGYILVKKD